jgi:hypothetical protein
MQSILHRDSAQIDKTLVVVLLAFTLLVFYVEARGGRTPPVQGHPVDIYQDALIDSLSANGVDSIVAMRCWGYTNGWNGYGYLIWTLNGTTLGRYVELVKGEIDPQLTVTTAMPDSLFGMAQRTMGDTAGQGFMKSKWQVSHDSECRVRVRLGREVGSWKMRGQEIYANPDRHRTLLLRAMQSPRLGISILIVDGLDVTDQFRGGLADTVAKPDTLQQKTIEASK